MVFILFSVSGIDFQAAQFVSQHGLKDASVWSKGQPLRSGRPHKDSGFSLNLPEVDSTREVIPVVESFFAESQDWLAALDKHSVQRLLHLGVTVGEARSFAPSLEFGFDFLRLLVDRRVELHITAYPTSDTESD